MTFGLGPAGTGKTFLAVAMAVSHLLEGKVERIILSRPAVEAGEKLGFLPGDLKDKVDPYLRPLYDALGQMISVEQTEKRLERGEIEVAPLAFMRGRTLSDAFVILDEAQNTTPMQMKMFLTRLDKTVIWLFAVILRRLTFLTVMFLDLRMLLIRYQTLMILPLLNLMRMMWYAINWLVRSLELMMIKKKKIDPDVIT